MGLGLVGVRVDEAVNLTTFSKIGMDNGQYSVFSTIARVDTFYVII